MTPVYLQRAQLHSALGPDLGSAASAYRADRRPLASHYQRLELPQQCPYFHATGSPLPLLERLDALLRSSLGEHPAPLTDCLLIIATTTLDIADIEPQMVAGQPFDDSLVTPLDRLAQRLRGAWGFAAAFTLNTACSSAANALLYGARLLGQGPLRRALVLSFETPSRVAMQGFAALELVSPSARYRPFHPERDGLILGECYASVLLSAEPGPAPLARLLGGFSACDTSSLTTTLEDGSHVDWVMRRALDSAGITAGQIDLVKLHGTATAANDHAEGNGMQRLFGRHLPPAVLLKPYLGHTLGACGLSESLLLLEALRQGSLPGVDYADQALLALPGAAWRAPVDGLLLANFFGFGGNNASLVLQGMGL
ncbi:MAG: beta-ketoacyl synthase N-terminal-like domain-containing protein [Pseudomonas sp.]|uniref:beta-ketoacyl synthase N-terminal-like domain-containing protein n=1 Tax=Pseudomonas sp. TaxID=306 RepID=UPI0033975CBD